MIEFTLEGTAAKPAANFAVTVVGIGGSGSNVLDRIALEGMPAADLVCMASDVRVLNNSMATRKVQLGPKLTQGLGAGGDPELGLEAAQASEVEIRDLFEGRSMIFICMGLGGGTGSGAAPYVARLARESGAFVVVFATMPFNFEGKRRQQQANVALNDLRHQANALITFENDRMGELVVPKKGIQEAFQLADRVIGQSVRAVTSLVTQRGLIRIGMDDLITALRNTDSRCLFGFGVSKGENRALEALSSALKSPLLDRGQLLAKASNVLVHVCGGPSMSLFEIQTLMGELQKHVDTDAQLLFGAAVDPALGDSLTVTVLTSLARDGGVAITPARTLAETTKTLESPVVTPVATPVELFTAPAAVPAAPAPAVPEPTPPPQAKRVTPAPVVVAEETEEEEEEEIVELKRSPRIMPAPAPIVAEEEEEDEEEEAPQAQITQPTIAAKRPQIVAPPAPAAEEEDEDEEPAYTPPPAKKFTIRDVLSKPSEEAPARPKPAPAGTAAPAHRPAPNPSSPFAPVRPAAQPAPAPAAISAEQQTFDERLRGANRGRFEKIDPTLEEGMDLDVPTFLRKKR
jgi:cell division protein FtsZ